MSLLRVSELAERCGLAPSTLRYYEGQGLLPATRSPAGHRFFGEEAVDRLAFIGTAKLLGLDLGEVADLLGVWEQGSCARVRADLRPRVAQRIAEAQERIAELHAFVERLETARTHLAGPDPAGPCDPSCTFLYSAAPAPPPVPVSGPARRPLPLAAPASREEPAVACTLASGEQDARLADWRRLLHGARRVPVDGGLRLEPAPGTDSGALLGLVAAERDCCGFFTFDVHLGRRLVVEVRAPAHARGLLDEVFGEETPATESAEEATC